MESSWILLSYFCVSNTVLCWIQEVPIDMSRLMTKYADYCGGESLCSATDRKESSTKPKTNVSHFCPKCSCSDDCEVNFSCCLDKSHSTCVQTKLPAINLEEENMNTMMVSFCPKAYGIPYQSCLNPISKIYSVDEMLPVQSLKTNRTYVNDFCSACHGEYEIIPWKYYISCQNGEVDLDGFTSLVFLLSYLFSDYSNKNLNCRLLFTPPVNSFPQQCKMNSLVRKCNVTGDWDEYDEEILNACSQYKKPFGFYQNVFCFLCNTAKKQRMSLLSQITDELEQPVKSKNNSRICYGCSKNIIYYSDAVVSLTESSINDTYIANITFLSYDIAQYLKNSVYEDEETLNSTEYDENVNLTSVYEEYIRSGGYQSWCQENHQVDKIFPGFKARKDCTCDENCYKFSSCCPDAAYFQRKSCSSADRLIPDSQLRKSFYFFIGKCPRNYGYPSIKLKCEQDLNLGILNSPVLNILTKEAYKNLYCFVCNNHENLTNLNVSEVKFWNASVVCGNGMLIPASMPSIVSVFEMATRKFCSIQYATSYFVDHCEPSVEMTINTCNAVGNRKHFSTHARFLCEKIDGGVMAKSRNKLYKNQICDLCNSEIFEEPISTCIFGRPTAENFTKCEQSPLDVQFYPFKNEFCKKCANFSGSVDLPEISYNHIFSLKLHQELAMDFESTDEQANRCRREQFNDVYKNVCRELKCSRGKILINTSCSYFMKYADEVQYNMALRVLLSSNTTKLDLLSILKNLQEILQQEIYEGLFQIEDKYIYSNESCTSQTTGSLEFLLYIRIKVQNSQVPIDREKLEIHLLKLKNITMNSLNLSVQFQPSLEAWFLPFYVHQKTTPYDGCYVKKITCNTRFTYNVNDLLICRQIELNASEYVTLDDRSRVYVKAVDRILNINEFLKWKKGHIRICIDSYRKIQSTTMQSDKSTFTQTVLTILTLVSTILSLLFLCATFAVYCILPSLRTVPGKNIMCFAFSLFFAQLFFIIRPFISEDTAACFWIGGLTHYFWICVFTCTNVCSFHMFRLFVRNSLPHVDRSSDAKLFTKYCITAFLFPFLPVAANLVLTYVKKTSLRLAYGGNRCFVDTFLSLFLTFILPIIFQLLLNLALFSVTFYYIKTTPKVKSSRERNEVSVFLKLFLLTGISWIFMIIDGYFDVSPFTVLATIVNGSQGLFLFISYICQKRVFQMLKNIYSKRQATSSSNKGSSSLNQTPTTHL